MNTHALKNKQKQELILNTLKAVWDNETIEDKGVDEDRIVAHICLEFGAGSRYVKEIVKNMVLVGLIQKVEKKLYYKENGDIHKNPKIKN